MLVRNPNTIKNIYNPCVYKLSLLILKTGLVFTVAIGYIPKSEATVVSLGEAIAGITVGGYQGPGLPEDTKPDDILVIRSSEILKKPEPIKWGLASAKREGEAINLSGNFGEGGTGWGIKLDTFALASADPAGGGKAETSILGNLTFINISETQTWFIDLDISWKWKAKSMGSDPINEDGIGRGLLTIRSLGDEPTIIIDEGESFHYFPGGEDQDDDFRRISVRLGPEESELITLQTSVLAEVLSLKPPKDTGPPQAPIGKDGALASFNADTKELSFINSIFTESSLFDGTIFTDDTILGANISIPTMTLTDEDGNGTFLFTNLDLNNRFVISSGTDVFMTAQLRSLEYSTNTNRFFWVLDDILLSGVDPTSPFFDPTLPDLGSDFIMALEEVLNPLSPGFSNMVLPYVILQPDVNLFSASSGFTEDTSFDYKSTICACMPQAVPEPSFIFGILTLGTLGAGTSLLRNKKQKKSAEKVS